MRSEFIFEFTNVVVIRNGAHALNNFTAAIPRDGVTAIFGPSGSGKSTLMRLCNRLEVAHSGRVRFDGRDITATTDPLRLRKQVGMCFQRPTPFRGTVGDNLRAACDDASTQQMEEMLGRVALTGEWLHRDATALSGGEAQRMCLARTMIAQPDVLLLDEPTSAVDPTATRIIEHAVRALADDHGVPALWVTHDRAQVERIADRVVHVEQGRCARFEAREFTPCLRLADDER